jgi:hypothetical protein
MLGKGLDWSETLIDSVQVSKLNTRALALYVAGTLILSSTAGRTVVWQFNIALWECG